ncbi:hypothetical protein STEG23_020513 [Scotinomys teguina]
MRCPKLTVLYWNVLETLGSRTLLDENQLSRASRGSPRLKQQSQNLQGSVLGPLHEDCLFLEGNREAVDLGGEGWSFPSVTLFKAVFIVVMLSVMSPSSTSPVGSGNRQKRKLKECNSKGDGGHQGNKAF